MVTLQTDRLILRIPGEWDLDAYTAMLGDAEIMRYIGDGQPLSRAMTWRNLAMVVGHWHLRGYGLWSVVERVSGEVVGRIGCWNPEGWPGLEVAWLLRRASWGQGYATEGARAALKFAFEQLRQQRVISCIHEQNTASVRVAQRLGEQLCGRTELMGQPALVFGIDRKEWLRRDE